jgi:hypothetical protein
MDSKIAELTHKIQSLPNQIVLISNGPGFQFISWLQKIISTGFSKKKYAHYSATDSLSMFYSDNLSSSSS